MKTDNFNPEALAAGQSFPDLAATDRDQTNLIGKAIAALQALNRDTRVQRCIASRMMKQEGLMKSLISFGHTVVQLCRGLLGLRQHKEPVQFVHFQMIRRVLPNGLMNETGFLGVGTFHWKHLHAVVRLRQTSNGRRRDIEIENLIDPVGNDVDPQELPLWLLVTFRVEMVREYDLTRRMPVGIHSKPMTHSKMCRKKAKQENDVVKQ